MPNRIRIGKESQWNYIVVAGEKEELNGTLDVNPRDKDDTLKGQHRVDLLHEEFQALMPKKSGAWERFYSNIWKAADYGFTDASALDSAKGAVSSAVKFKLTVEHKYMTMGLMVQTAADLAGCGFDLAISADKSISPNGRLPVMHIADDNETMLFETGAMLHHIARQSPESGLAGSSPFETAKIDQWITWC